MWSSFSKVSKYTVFIMVFLWGNNRYAGIHCFSPGTVAFAQYYSPSSTRAGQPLPYDTTHYNDLLLHLVHHKPTAKWPVKTVPHLPGAILPYKRIVAYYGNFYTAKMGILGEHPPDTMLKHLMQEVSRWQKADTAIPVVPAIHYIAVTAQAHPGQSGKYRARMPFAQINKAIGLARKVNGIVFLDIQIGWSSVHEEIAALDTFLRLPDVHLAIDPEYSMKGRQVPCTKIGTFDAADVNTAINYLAELVRKYHLPPKVLVVHRFTKEMVTNYKKIMVQPEVQVVMHMDGFGFPAKKVDSYVSAIANEPVEYTGFKIFYKNDLLSYPNRLTTIEEILNLYPSPIYIQYQ